jgi:glycosyltransferase involved in cell wall biosynthesis
MDAQNMRPKVLVLTKLFWPDGGGGELATYLIVKNVLSKSFDVLVVSGTRRSKPDVLRGANYVHWSALESKYKPVEWLRLLANTRWLRKLVERVDIVYIPSHTLMPMAMATKLVKPSVKVVLHLHNYQALTYTSIILAGRRPDVATDVIVEYREHRSLLRALLAGFGHHINRVNRYAIIYADRVICTSQRQYEILLKYLPELRSKAVVIYNPPPPLPDMNRMPSEEPALIYPGGDSYVKGFHAIIEALSKILKRHECKVYAICGRETPSRENLRLIGLCRRLGDNFIILNRLPHEKYLKLHENAWGLLFPSMCEEPLPYTIVESMLIGTMPIAARIGGVPEIVRGSPAEEYLFMPGNINELVDKVDDLLSLSREGIMDAGMKLREHALELFNREEIEDKITACLTS